MGFGGAIDAFFFGIRRTYVLLLGSLYSFDTRKVLSVDFAGGHDYLVRVQLEIANNVMKINEAAKCHRQEEGKESVGIPKLHYRLQQQRHEALHFPAHTSPQSPPSLKQLLPSTSRTASSNSLRHEHTTVPLLQISF